VTSRGIEILRAQLDAANQAADKAIAAYDQRCRELVVAAKRSEPRYNILKRDDGPLAQHGNAAAFAVSNATRLAASLLCELVAVEVLS